MSARRFFTDEKERRKWQNPEAILIEVGVKKGFAFVDIGCGAGFFAVPAARIVGKGGKVYGVDADSEAIERLKQKASREGLDNFNLKVGRAEETIFCDKCADIVFFGIVLHDFQDPRKVLSNAKRMLKPAGQLIDLDWKEEPMRFGPPLQIRFSARKASNLIEKAGYKIDYAKEEGPYHYLIAATQKS